MKKIALLVVVLGLVISPAVYADEGGHPAKMKMRDKEHRLEAVFNKLHLTDEQKNLLEENKVQSRAKRQSLAEKRRSLKESMNQELMKPEIDMKKIGDLHAQIKALQAQMADDRLSSILQVRKILKVEQFSEFITMIKQLRQEKQNTNDE